MAGQKLALLVGVSKYKCLPDLRGPSGDVAAMEAMLKQQGFATDTLLDQDAHKQDILDALAELSDRAEPDDAVVFYYSGHGARHVLKIPADSSRPELPSFRILDSIVPHDSGGRAEITTGPDGDKPQGDCRDIFDIDFDDQIRQFQTSNVTLLFDTCFAGTITRGGDASTLIPEPALGLRLAPDAARISDEDRDRLLRRARDMAREDEKRIPSESRAIVFAACRDNEFAAERDYSDRDPWHRLGLRDDQRYLGTFTYHLLVALKQAGPRTTWGDVRTAVTRGIRCEDAFPLQHPVLFEGSVARGLFVRDRARPAPYLRVHWVPPARADVTGAPAGRGFWITGGAAHGLKDDQRIVIRSKWSSDEEGESDVAAGRKDVVATVKKVRGVSSFLVVNDTDHDESLRQSIFAGERAFIMSAAPQPVRLVCPYPGKRLEEQLLRQALEETKRFVLITEPDPRAITIRCVPPRRMEPDSPGRRARDWASPGEWTWCPERHGKLVARPQPAELIAGGAPAWLDRDLLEILRLVPSWGQPGLDDALAPIDAPADYKRSEDLKRAVSQLTRLKDSRGAIMDNARARARSLVTALQRYVRYQELLTIAEEEPKKLASWDDSLADQMTIELRRRTKGSDDWEPLEMAGKNYRISEGQTLEVILHRDKDVGEPDLLRVSLVAFLPDYSIQLLLPAPSLERYDGARNSELKRFLVGALLKPDDTVRVMHGYRERANRIELPEGSPWRTLRSTDPEDDPVGGRIHLKLFVSECDADFEFYEQDGSFGPPATRAGTVRRTRSPASDDPKREPWYVTTKDRWTVKTETIEVLRRR